MSVRNSFVLVLCATIISTDALAQASQHFTYIPGPTASLFYRVHWATYVGFLTIMAILIIAAIGCVCIDVIRAKVAEGETQLRRQASLMREMAAHQDSHTDMMRSEIDRARAHGEYQDRPEIAEHERRLRALRNNFR